MIHRRAVALPVVREDSDKTHAPSVEVLREGQYNISRGTLSYLCHRGRQKASARLEKSLDRR